MKCFLCVLISVCLCWMFTVYSPCCALNLFSARIKKKENDKDEDVKEEEREPKDRRCFQCGDMGHVRRDCPEYRHLKQRTVGAPGIPRTKRHQIFLYDSISVILADTYILKHTFRVLLTLADCLYTSSSHGANHGELPVHPHPPDTCRLSWKNQTALWMCEYSS